ncbi:MAG: AAA family ATPase [Candidatus Komeilibacteria bacterium]|nr:AAA family ATPase [Candidatus Komeilibacteria bacterium]
MTMQIRRAERKQAKLRIGISAPSGAGKTYSALLLAYGITSDWEKIALIDTENGSGELYSNLGEYNVITLSAPFAPERYIEAIKACEDAGMEVIIVDSVSHEWDGKGGCLETNELLAQTKFKGNSWAAWSATTPKHRKFIEAIVTSPAHMITTARSKTDTIQTEDKKIKKVGTKEIQREGFEYELTVNFNIDRDGHFAMASKDRTSMFIDVDPFVITVETGKKIKQWNENGSLDYVAVKGEIMSQLKRLNAKRATAEEAKQSVKDLTGIELKEENYQAIATALKNQQPAKPADPAPKAPAENSAEPLIPEQPADKVVDDKLPGLKMPVVNRATDPKAGPMRLATLKSLLEIAAETSDPVRQVSFLGFMYGIEGITKLDELTVAEADHLIQVLKK